MIACWKQALCQTQNSQERDFPAPPRSHVVHLSLLFVSVSHTIPFSGMEKLKEISVSPTSRLEMISGYLQTNLSVFKTIPFWPFGQEGLALVTVVVQKYRDGRC